MSALSTSSELDPPFDFLKTLPYATAREVDRLVGALPCPRGTGRVRRRLDAASLRLVTAVAQAAVPEANGAHLFRLARNAARLLLEQLAELESQAALDQVLVATIRQLAGTLACLPRAGPRRPER